MLIQRRGGPQVQTLLERFGLRMAAQDVEIPEIVLPVASVPRLDNLCMGVAQVNPSVAERSLVQLFNPATSRVTVIIHRIWVALGAADEVSFRTNAIALADAETTLAVVNRKIGNQPEPVALIRSLQGSASGSTVGIWRLDTAARSVEFNLNRIADNQEFSGVSLARGRGFMIVPQADNIGNTVTFLWSERITE